MSRLLSILLLALILASCVNLNTPVPIVELTVTDTVTPFQPQPPTSTFVLTASPTPTPTSTPPPLVPLFERVVLILFENKEFGTVIGNPNMPYYNSLAQENTLLTQFYAVSHPSLPN